MCGIFGFVGSSPTKEIGLNVYHLLYNLAIASEARGIDATGFVARWSPHVIMADKAPMKASAFVKTSHKFASLRRNLPTTFIGHTRLGTGSSPQINNNNHPFFGQEYHMVHNGVIPGWRQMVDTHKIELESETDSEVVIRLLEKKRSEGLSLDDSVEWILNNVWGNMAIALLDTKNPWVWLFRNDNPTYYFDAPTKLVGNYKFFASTKDIFEKAWEDTFGAKLEESKVNAYSLSDNTLHQLCAYPTPHKKKGKVYHLQRFFWPTRVENKFRKSKTYWSDSIWGMESDHRGRHFSPSKSLSVQTTFQNPKDPTCKSRLSQEQIDEVAKIKGKDVIVDSLPIADFNLLGDIMDKIEACVDD